MFRFIVVTQAAILKSTINWVAYKQTEIYFLHF